MSVNGNGTVSKKNIYLDTTITRCSIFNTGIQRVVKNIVNCSGFAEDAFDVNIIETFFENGFVVDIDYSIKNTNKKIKQKRYAPLRFASKIFRFILDKKTYFRMRALAINFVLNQSPNSQFSWIEPISGCGEANILLLIDSNWRKEIFPHIDEFRKAGGKVCAVMYDLIPFSHPETVEDTTRIAHTEWWLAAPQHLDAVVCISKSVRDEFLVWQNQQGVKNPLPASKVGHFYLGSNFIVDDPLLRLINDPDGFYIMVGSLEPRKDHDTAISAFEIFWSMGHDQKLVICGAHGWKCDELKKRIYGHQEYQKRLFLFESVGDRDLAILYKHAKALIICSVAEGYGLPIIEAQLQGTQVICTDIKVFREVAGESASYFEVRNPESLAKVVVATSNCIASNSDKFTLNADVLTWKESTNMLIDESNRCVN